MEKLLVQIRQALREEMSWVRSFDVCLIPHAGMIPEDAGMPYIGIKDGGVQNRHEQMSCTDRELRIDVYVYDRLGKRDENIQGLHAKIREIATCLRGRLFDGSLLSVTPVSEYPVTLLATKKGLVIRAGLHLIYEREEEYV